MPRRNSNLLREIVDPVDRAPFIAAGDHERRSYSRYRVLHDFNQGKLPLAPDRRHIEFPSGNKFINQCTLPHRAEDDSVWPNPVFAVRNVRGVAGHARNVLLQIMRSSHHAPMVILIHIDRREIAMVDEGKTSRTPRRHYVLFLADGHRVTNCAQRKERKNQNWDHTPQIHEWYGRRCMGLPHGAFFSRDWV